MDKTRRIIRLIAVACLCAAVVCLLAGCGGYHSTSSSASKSSSSSPATAATTTHPKAQTYGGLPKTTTPPKPKYEDSRWPTTHPELLAIPESSRWYNAWNLAGTSCTVAGPVVNVYQATESNGMPIFIDIGAAYPNDNGVSLVVWGDQYDEFAQMINAVDDGGAWLSVTGYLSVYNGHLQFNAGDGYVEYTWWTRVS